MMNKMATMRAVHAHWKALMTWKMMIGTQLAANQERKRVECHWLTASTSTIAAIIIVPFDQFGGHPWFFRSEDIVPMAQNWHATIPDQDMVINEAFANAHGLVPGDTIQAVINNSACAETSSCNTFCCRLTFFSIF